MKNKDVKILSIIFIVLAIFNVVVFVLPLNQRNDIFWITYVAVTISITSQFAFLKLGFKEDKPVESILYGYPIYRLGFVLLSASLISAIIFLPLNESGLLKIWLVVIVYVLILGLSAIGLIIRPAARDIIEKIEEETKIKKAFKEELSTKIFNISFSFEDESKKDLEKLIEDIKYSDPISNSATKDIEEKILLKANKLEDKKEKELIKEISVLLKQRNELCKKGK